MTHGDGGKGDKQRPTNWDHFSENFDRIFGKKPPKEVDQHTYNQVMDAVNLASNPAGLKLRNKENNHE